MAAHAARLTRAGDAARAVPPMTIAFALSLFVLSNFFITPRDNNTRSARSAARLATTLAASPDVAIYHRYLPEEAAVYLPVGSAEVPAASRLVVIVGDRRPGAAPLTAADFQPWFTDRTVVSAETVAPAPREASGRWSVVEIGTARR
jgi:hypothetical protein